MSAYRTYHEHSAIPAMNMDHTRWLAVEDWPEDWVDLVAKRYPRMPQHVLPPPGDLPPASVQDALAGRRSYRAKTEFRWSAQSLSDLLHHSFGIAQNLTGAEVGSRRAYPSAGARFPVEMYIIARGVAQLESGLYHYAPIGHVLEAMIPREITEEVQAVYGYEWIVDAQLILVMTGELSRALSKYAERAYRFALIEAGHLAQDVLLTAATMNAPAAPVAGFADGRLTRLLDLTHSEEFPMHSVVLP